MTLQFPTSTVREPSAELALALMLSTARKQGISLRGKTLGIIGFGQSGARMAQQARFGFGMSVVVYDPLGVSPDQLSACEGEAVADLDDLLPRCDVVSLHCRSIYGRPPMITATRLNQMKADSILINAAAETLVDQKALAHALWFETIGGAAVLSEDLTADLRDCDQLVHLPKTTTTPRAHVA